MLAQFVNHSITSTLGKVYSLVYIFNFFLNLIYTYNIGYNIIFYVSHSFFLATRVFLLISSFLCFFIYYFLYYYSCLECMCCGKDYYVARESLLAVKNSSQSILIKICFHLKRASHWSVEKKALES